MSDLDFDKWIVVPWYATGSTEEGTRRYVWKTAFARRGFHPSHVAGAFPDSFDGETVAGRLAVDGGRAERSILGRGDARR